MTVYPFQLDDDTTIVRIDDNLSELGTEAINQLRSAVFAIEAELGTNASGTLTSLADRVGVSINPNGTIKSSALTSVGLATLPLDDAQVGANAGIKESKLALNYSTADLNAQITSNISLLNSTAAFVATTNADLLSHISGATLLSDGSTAGRHVASHVDINAVPSDPRDIGFVWTGLLDKDGNFRTATTVAEALLQINNAFVDHELNETGDAHTATGISVDTSEFRIIPQSANTVQKSLDAIDEANVLVIQEHQANQHSNGVPRESRSVILNDVDGYSQNIVPSTEASAFLSNCPATTPIDNNSTGDDIISFNPDNTGNLFDEKFSRVSIGDVIRVNYGNGIEGVFNVESKRHIPGVEWVVRINGTNLYPADGYSAYARIDKKRFETNSWGTLAVAPANNDIDISIMSSVIVGNPKAARVLGIAFDPTQLDSTHYNLWIQMYPTGDPNDDTVVLPPIDVTGDQGVSPGSYTIETVVKTVNNAFRSGGYNYRFMAFEHDGEFGIMMTDAIDNASFSIINGSLSAGALVSGVYSNNVIGDAVDGKDALGFGYAKASVASPVFTSSYSSSNAAKIYPTVIHPPLDNRDYSVNGISRDSFRSTYETTPSKPYWDGYISNRTSIGATSVEITYQIDGDLTAAELKPGKTITVQPAVERTDALFSEVDYGRFVIKSVNFGTCCPGVDATTSITVVNGLHATGSPIGGTGVPPLPVKIYFGEDSVSFNQSNVIDAVNSDSYFRYHEIFVNEEGSTFSHERARMPIQTETSSGVATANFKIKSVSPKLRGFTDSGSVTDNKYVRFVVTSYDSVSGEYDGYLGRRIPSTNDVTDFGRIVTARKNVPTRFYDNTDVDYIEIEYVEPDQYPGTNILSTNSQRYVDIEVFDTLATNQENFRIAGCGLLSNSIDTIVDLREFGNVSETDFTDSAIRFIEAGDRLLHSNGVIAGFTYKGESSAGTLDFNGGLALVNGHISTLNDQSISIPEIVQDTGAGQTNTLNWAICVNDQDLLEAIPVTPTKQHFFARRTGDSDNYYIPSVTFSELTANRKDLCIISVVNVTIASVTVNSVSDARKLINNDTLNIPLTLSNDADKSSFTSFEQVIAWCDGLETEVNVHVNGDILIDEEVDLRGVNNLNLIGAGGTIIVTSQTGFRINSGVKLNDIDIVYNGSFSGLSGTNNLHLDEGHACVYIDASSTDSNGVQVTECRFSRTLAEARPPFVLARSTTSRTIDDIKINDNTFSPEGTADILNGAAVLYYDSPESTPTGVISNAEIDNNTVGGKNMIAVTAGTSSAMHPMCRDVTISRNKMPLGYIGYLITTHSDGYIPNDVGLLIEKNKVGGITRIGSDGKYSSSGYGFSDDFGTGYVNIYKNNTSFISSIILDNPGGASTTVQPVSSLVIDSNIVRFTKPRSEITADLGTALDRGIEANGASLLNPCKIINNQIIGNPDTGTADSSYGLGIFCNVFSDIQGNYIKHWRSLGILSTAVTVGSTIKGNTLVRGGQPTGPYITAASSDIVIDNKLDTRTTDDASNFTTITGGSVVERNVNHVKTRQIAMNNVFLPGDRSFGAAAAYPNLNYISTSGAGYIGVINYGPGATSNINGYIRLYDILPPGAKLVSVSFDWDTNATWNSGNIRLYIDKDDNTSAPGLLVEESAPLTDVSGTLSADSLDIDQTHYINVNLNNVNALVGGFVFVRDLVVQYTW